MIAADIANAALLFVAALRLYVPPKTVGNLAFAALLLSASALLILTSGGSR